MFGFQLQYPDLFRHERNSEREFGISIDIPNGQQDDFVPLPDKFVAEVYDHPFGAAAVQPENRFENFHFTSSFFSRSNSIPQANAARRRPPNSAG